MKSSFLSITVLLICVNLGLGLKCYFGDQDNLGDLKETVDGRPLMACTKNTTTNLEDNAMESSIECEVCFSGYNFTDRCPKSLPCGHTVCGSCVTENLKVMAGLMDCPFCRTSCGRSVKTIDDFPSTFAIIQLLEKDLSKGNEDGSKASPEGEESGKFVKKRKTEIDQSITYILNCNNHLEHLEKLKEEQKLAMENIDADKNKLLKEIEILEGKSKEAKLVLKKVDNSIDEGKDVVKGLKSLQDHLQSASSSLGLNMASQGLQHYHIAAQEWKTAKVVTLLEHPKNAFNNEKAQCQHILVKGEKYYSCLDCRTQYGDILCGNCFVNSKHFNHRTVLRLTLQSGEQCNCGNSSRWKKDPTCHIHQSENQTPMPI